MSIERARGHLEQFGLDDRVFLDASLRRFETVFPAPGSPNSVAELTLPELADASNAEGWVEVTKPRA